MVKIPKSLDKEAKKMIDNHLNLVMKTYKGELIFEGSLDGQVIEVIYATTPMFIFKPNENIAGIPEKFICTFLIYFQTHTKSQTSFGTRTQTISIGPLPFVITKDDKITIVGTLLKLCIPEWEKESYIMYVTGLYNETLKCGF